MLALAVFVDMWWMVMLLLFFDVIAFPIIVGTLVGVVWCFFLLFLVFLFLSTFVF